MPYIITTQAPDRTVWEGKRSSVVTRPPVTRRAVATLAEVVATLNGTGADWTLDGANGESGTVGPLPDGSMITVERVDNSTLGYRFGLLTVDHPQLWMTETLVEHFNRAQS